MSMWNAVLSEIKKKVDEPSFDTWFKALKPIKEDAAGNSILLAVPDTFFKDWIENNYLKVIDESASAIGLYGLRIVFEVNPSLFDTNKDAQIGKREKTSKQKPNLNPRYTFESFVIGHSNRFAHAAAMAVAENPAAAYNPLFIYGGVGLGKTHLMQAIAHKSLEINPEITITYLSSEQFTNELIDAIQHRSTKKFRNKYRNVDLLLIDDIQFIGGKESTQEEFFHTFNTLYDAHKQIVISSDRHPKEISTLEERLISRFGWGLITDIQPPDIETRVAILKKKIEKEKSFVPDDVILFIAESIKSNIRELEGALNRVIAFSILEKRPISLEFTKAILKDTISSFQKKLTVDDIMAAVADRYKISTADIKAKKRNRTTLIPRQIAIYLTRELTDMSLPEIGLAFGGKDHTTVLHSYNKILKQKKIDMELDNTIKDIMERLN